MNETASPRLNRPTVAADSPDPVFGGSALKFAIVEPTHHDRGTVAAHTTSLAHHLAQAGHDVTLISWSRPFPGRGLPAEGIASEVSLATSTSCEAAALPRRIRALSWARPDTWVRTGWRLRGFDAIVIVQLMPLVVPAHLVMLRAAGAGGPRSIVIAHNVLPQRTRPGVRALVRSLFERVDAVLVNSAAQARLAGDLHASRVSVSVPAELSRLPGQVGGPDLSSQWAHYVGAMEALASPHWQARAQEPKEASEPRGRLTSAQTVRRRLTSVYDLARRRRPTIRLTRQDLPEWARPTDVLEDAAAAQETRQWARSYGLPRSADPIAAWSALGALAAIIRLRDDGRRSAVIFDGSGARSPLSGWARAIGFAPVELDLTDRRASEVTLDVDTASLDVITRLYPNGCDSEDVDEFLSQASVALCCGGLVSFTLPLGPASADGAVGPADVRAILARADDLGFVLVGDFDGEITTLMRVASVGDRPSDAAYALMRLTFRRR